MRSAFSDYSWFVNSLWLFPEIDLKKKFLKLLESALIPKTILVGFYLSDELIYKNWVEIERHFPSLI